MQLSLDTILLSTLPAPAPRAVGTGVFALPAMDPALDPLAASPGQGAAAPGKALPPPADRLPVDGSAPDRSLPTAPSATIEPMLAAPPAPFVPPATTDANVVALSPERPALPLDAPLRDAANPVALLAARLAAFVAERAPGTPRIAAKPIEDAPRTTALPAGAATLATAVPAGDAPDTAAMSIDDDGHADPTAAGTPTPEPVTAAASAATIALPLAIPPASLPIPIDATGRAASTVVRDAAAAGPASAAGPAPVAAGASSVRPPAFAPVSPALALVGATPPTATRLAPRPDSAAVAGLPVLPGGAELDDIMAKIAAVVAPRDPAAPNDAARPVTPVAAGIPAAAALPTTAEMFGLPPRREAAAGGLDAALATVAGAVAHGVAPAAAAGAADQAPLDLGREAWPQAMIDRIEALRDAAEETSTRIRVSPDALGPIDLSLRRDGDAVHVRLAAEHAATRALLTDAQRTLTDLADQRGLKLASTTVEHGPGGGDQPGRGGRQGEPSAPARPASATPHSAAASEATDDDTRIA